VGRWGEGSAHLHVWFMGRPAGFLQLRSSFAAIWDDVPPPLPEPLWRENLAVVERASRRAAAPHTTDPGGRGGRWAAKVPGMKRFALLGLVLAAAAGVAAYLRRRSRAGEDNWEASLPESPPDPASSQAEASTQVAPAPLFARPEPAAEESTADPETAATATEAEATPAEPAADDESSEADR
jgi:hypothetical protein